jgi:hypothetical protein
MQALPRVAQFLAYGRDGVWHIWIGIDHVLFLVSLLLPAVFAELRKPIYTEVQFDDTAWTAAAELLELELQHAIDTRHAAA